MPTEKNLDIDISTDIAGVASKLKNVASNLKDIARNAKRVSNLDIDADVDDAELDLLHTKLQSLSDKKIEIDVDRDEALTNFVSGLDNLDSNKFNNAIEKFTEGLEGRSELGSNIKRRIGVDRESALSEFVDGFGSNVRDVSEELESFGEGLSKSEKKISRALPQFEEDRMDRSMLRDLFRGSQIELDIDKKRVSPLDFFDGDKKNVERAFKGFANIEAETQTKIDNNTLRQLKRMFPTTGRETSDFLTSFFLPSRDDDGEMRKSGLMRSVKRLTPNMMQLWNIFAKLVPLMIVFVGALPAAIAGLTALATSALALAGALGAIGALGLFGLGVRRSDGIQGAFKEIQEIIGDLKDEFLSAFAPLAQKFAPLVSDALDGLTALFDVIASKGELLLELRSKARGFGEWIAKFIPKALETIIRFAQATSDIFTGLGQWLFNNIDDIALGLAETLRRLLPTLQTLALTIVDIIPDLIRFSEGFLMVTNMIIDFLSFIGFLINQIVTLGGFMKGNTKILGFLISAFLAFITVSSIASTIISYLAGSVFSTLVSALLSAVTSTYTFSSSLITYITSASGATMATRALTVALAGLTTAVITLLAITGLIALTGLIGGMAMQMSGLADKTKIAEGRLSSFARTAKNLDGTNVGVGVSGRFSGKPKDGKGGGISYEQYNTVNIEDSDADQEEIERSLNKTTRRGHSTAPR